jgi:type IV pilus assembly protein PilV
MKCSIVQLARQEHGFTLIEIMIAVAVLTIGILGVMVMQTRVIEANATAIHRTEAVLIGQDIMEGEINRPFAGFTVSNTTLPPVMRDRVYTVTRKIETPATLAGAFRVTVTVSWNEGSLTGFHSNDGAGNTPDVNLDGVIDAEDGILQNRKFILYRFIKSDKVEQSYVP